MYYNGLNWVKILLNEKIDVLKIFKAIAEYNSNPKSNIYQIVMILDALEDEEDFVSSFRMMYKVK